MRTFYVLAGAVATAYAAYQYFVANDQDDDRPPRPPPPVHRPPIRPQTHEYSRTHESSQPPVHRPPIRPQTYEPSQPPVHHPPSRPQTYEPSQPPVHRPPSPPQTYSRTHESSQPPVHRPPIRPQTYEPSQPPVHRPPIRPQTYEPSQPPVHRPPSPPQTYEYSRTNEPSQPPVHRHDEQQQRQSIDSSQRDDITPKAAYAASLRARAKQEGDLMSQCYTQSHVAYEGRDHLLAKALSDEGKRHERNVEMLNAEASAIIFEENNRGRDACEVDLHGLFVKEAIVFSEIAVTAARQRGYPEIRFIVGQGNHSEKGIARLKPALQEAMQRGYHVEVDPKNLGVLVVQLGDS